MKCANRYSDFLASAFRTAPTKGVGRLIAANGTEHTDGNFAVANQFRDIGEGCRKDCRVLPDGLLIQAAGPMAERQENRPLYREQFFRRARHAYCSRSTISCDGQFPACSSFAVAELERPVLQNCDRLQK